MRQDSRLSRVLHVLIHMDQYNAPMTSELIAKMLNTNPAVVRRTMAGLRNAGYVSSEKGHGGGWTLSKPISEITLLDVYHALGNPELFAFGFLEPTATCLIEQAVNKSLEQTLQEAEKAILNRFGELNLADIANSFNCSDIQKQNINIH